MCETKIHFGKINICTYLLVWIIFYFYRSLMLIQKSLHKEKSRKQKEKSEHSSFTAKKRQGKQKPKKKTGPKNSTTWYWPIIQWSISCVNNSNLELGTLQIGLIKHLIKIPRDQLFFAWPEIGFRCLGHVRCKDTQSYWQKWEKARACMILYKPVLCINEGARVGQIKL